MINVSNDTEITNIINGHNINKCQSSNVKMRIFNIRYWILDF